MTRATGLAAAIVGALLIVHAAISVHQDRKFFLAQAETLQEIPLDVRLAVVRS